MKNDKEATTPIINSLSGILTRMSRWLVPSKRKLEQISEDVRDEKKQRKEENETPVVPLPFSLNSSSALSPKVDIPEINNADNQNSAKPVLCMVKNPVPEVMPTNNPVTPQLMTDKLPDILNNEILIQRPRPAFIANQTLSDTKAVAQQEEIEYLINDERAYIFLSQLSEKHPEVNKYYNELKDCVLTYSSLDQFDQTNNILDALAMAVIETRVQECIHNNSFTLNCNDMHLTRFPNKIITKAEYENFWSTVTVLNFRDNRIKNLPAEIGLLKLLEVLTLTNNRLQSLPPEIGELGVLSWLKIDVNQLKSLPMEIGNLTLLKGLLVRENQLQSLPTSIEQLVVLECLSLTNNQLHSVPPEIGKLKMLDSLELENNQLKFIPPEMGNLKRLTSLFLSNNQLEDLPISVLQLGNASLRCLKLHNNQLQSLPEQAEGLYQLKLCITNNELKKIPELGCDFIGNNDERMHPSAIFVTQKGFGVSEQKKKSLKL